MKFLAVISRYFLKIILLMSLGYELEVKLNSITSGHTGKKQTIVEPKKPCSQFIVLVYNNQLVIALQP